MIHHVNLGKHIHKLVWGFPYLSLSASIQPITRTVLRVRLTIRPEFDWDDKMHGTTSEPWWVWVEDAENDHMYHSEYFLLQRKQVIMPISKPRPFTLTVCISLGERWRGTGPGVHDTHL